MLYKDIQILEQKTLTTAKPTPIPLGASWLLAYIEGLFRRRPRQKKLFAQAEHVMALEAQYAPMTDVALAQEVTRVKTVFRLTRDTAADVTTALALVRETAFRVTGMRPYKTQIAGALGIFAHCIVEMATGEGKTLTAALAASIIAFRGRGCHVLTSNDYLAARDAATMMPLFTALGLRCTAITQGMTPEARRCAYAEDITYATSKEVVADYLRDQLALGICHNPTKMFTRALCHKALPITMQRGLYCAVVDEADSVLCDGGSTPLIISTPDPDAPEVAQYQAASDMAKNMRRGLEYQANMVFREIKLTPFGRQHLSRCLDKTPWAKLGRAAELLMQALEAREFFHESIQYVIHEGKVVLVDEPTGRIMPDHEWRDGLHQAVSAKEGLEIIPPKATSAQSTFQDFFRRYSIMGGMTGTAWEARGELYQFYNLHVVKIPTHRPLRRVLSGRALHEDVNAKITHIVHIVTERQAKGQPVLVGTSSIEASETVASALVGAGVPHATLNATHHAKEADIVAEAGQWGKVTVATNMAGRGTDITLSPQTREVGGLLVILTERYTSRRVDRQLHGRSGRQGDVGEVMEIIALSDILFNNHPLCRNLLTLLKNIPLVGQRLAFWVVGVLQWCRSRKETIVRRRMVKANQQFARMISYASHSH